MIITCPNCGKPARSSGTVDYWDPGKREKTPKTLWVCAHGCKHGISYPDGADWDLEFVIEIIDGKEEKVIVEPSANEFN